VRGYSSDVKFTNSGLTLSWIPRLTVPTEWYKPMVGLSYSEFETITFACPLIE
jgi:hypothetical protein